MTSKCQDTRNENEDPEAIVVAPMWSWDAMNETSDDGNTKAQLAHDNRSSKNVFKDMDYHRMLYNDSDSVDNDDDSDYDYGKRKKPKKSSDKNKRKKFELSTSEYSSIGSNKLEVDGQTKQFEDVDKILDMPTKLKSKSVFIEDGNKGVEIPEGWNRSVFMRTSGATSGVFDVYYISPLGKKIRSKVQMQKYCEENGLDIDLSIIKFSHKASDSEKYAIFRKASGHPANELSPDITADPEDGKIEILKNPEDVYIPDGWSRRVFQRLQGKHAGKLDVIYIDPNGRKFRSKIEIIRYFSENNIQSDIDVDAMCFGYGQRGFLPVLPEHLKVPKSSPKRSPKTAPKTTPKSSRVKKGPTKTKKLPMVKIQKPLEDHSKIFDQEKVPEPDSKIEDGLFSLKWNNHKTTFLENLKFLREKSSYTDATLAVEGKFYPVHKLVMSACSEYFSGIFERTSCKSPVIVLQDVRSRDIEALLDYMYIGEVNVNQSDLAALLKTAECLRIKGFAFLDDLHKNSTTCHDDDHWDSPSPKRRRHDSNTIPPCAPSPILAPQMYDNVLANPVQTPSLRRRSTSNTEQNEPSNFVKIEMDVSEEFNNEQDEPSDMNVEMGDAEEQEERFSTENNASSDHESGEDYAPEISMTEHEPENDESSSLPKPSLEQSNVVATFEIGHRAKVRQNKSKEGFTHDWEIFVEGHEGAELEAFVEKVVFTLHKSFAKPRRVIKEPPYRVAEKGYGSFALPIEIFFKTNEEPKKHRLEYDLCLQPLDGSPISIVKKEHVTFHKPGDDFRQKLLAGGGELQCNDKYGSNTGNGRSIVRPSKEKEIKAH